MNTEQYRHTSKMLKLLLWGTVVLAISACGSTQERKDSTPASETSSLSYQVQSGDSLALIAQRLTGHSENWDEIASVNGVSNPKSLQVGMILLIPEYLIPEMAASNANESLPSAETDSDYSRAEVATEQTPLETPLPRKITPRRDWVFQASSLPGRVQAPVVVHRAQANRIFDVERISVVDAPATSAVSSSPKRKLNQSIRVIGTYYPKGIYSKPSYTSKLLMRVAPGTKMKLEESLGDWLQIRTNKGSGYIRSIDAEVLGASSANRMLLSDNNG